MTTLTKVLIGAASVTTVAVTVYVIKKSQEKKTDDVSEETEEKESVIQRIKTYAMKKAIRILGWVALHQEQIEAAGTIIGLVGTIISITGAIRDFVRNNDLSGKLDEIKQRIDDMELMCTGEFKALYEDHDILAHNQAKIAKAVGVPVKESIA